MSPEESAEQKTEKPTPRKRRRAREEGHSAQSNEVNNAAVLLAGTLALAFFGADIARRVTQEVRWRLSALWEPEITTSGIIPVLREGLSCALGAIVPVMVCVGGMGGLAAVLQSGFTVAPQKIVPKLKSLNPIKGLKNLFSLSALMRLAVALAKVCLIGTVAFFLLRSRLSWLRSLAGKHPRIALKVGTELAMSLMAGIVVLMAVVAVADYAYQRWKYNKELKMTKTERKEEMKREEGHSEVKNKRSQMQREISQRRMMQAVPEADVVVSNPTHVAVALQWEEKEMEAPVVVAKGADLLAQRIKAIARESGVPVLERANLARTLHEAVEVDMEIPPALYRAVAEVLAFVLKKR